ncbi:MAG: hypothetical protein HY553_17175 [Elusimicrobia bacterium]|nr:hypothetical protein [Elusimicrobiota bacterium]
MHPIFGLLLIVGVGIAGLALKVRLEQARAAAPLPPDSAQLRRQRDAARAVLSVVLFLLALVLGFWLEACGPAVGALIVLATLWLPWAPLRMLAAAASLIVGGMALLGALLIVAGGPDSRGGLLPNAGPVVLGLALAHLGVVGAFLRAEWLLLSIAEEDSA